MTAVSAVAALCASASPALAGDINQPLCPNEALMGFSPALPDCRAYELMSPNFQNGYNTATVIAATADGGRVLASSVATFAGAESNTLGPTYSMSRGPQRWETASISPSAVAFPANLFYAASLDLSKSVWALRAPTQSIYAQDLYLRESDGAFVKIGSMVPPASQTGPLANGYQLFLGDYLYAGASRDLSHVYFSIVNGVFGGAVWPGDTTVPFSTGARAFSLYEYVGLGNSKPALVGVDGQGRLISDCATYLGSDESRDVYNAVSEDGRRTFFTAEGHTAPQCTESIPAPAVTEVYARLDGSESVPISEPLAADCAECQTGTQGPAEFQGASADGTKAFFTTAQELLPGNEATNLYEFDFDASRGKRIVRVSRGAAAPEVQGVVRVSQDGSRVYFVARARLTDEPRGGSAGECLAGEGPGEKAEEEEKHEGRCRAKAGADNLYVFERDAAHPGGRLAFVATLAEADASDWQTVDGRPAQVTPTGSRLVVQSAGALTPDVAGEAPQVYEYDALSEELIRVSRGQSGFPQGTTNANNSYALITSQSYEFRFAPTSANTYLSISSDGNSVMFVSPAVLTPEAAEAGEHGAEQIYEYRSAGTIASGDVFLLSGGRNALSARPQGLDQRGANAFFATPDQLVPVDTNTGFDLYDAHLDGGFEKHEAPSCSGEGCLEPLAAPGAPQAAPGTLSIGPEPPIPAPTPAAPSGASHTTPSSALAKALKACRHKRRRAARLHCERSARKRLAHKARSRHASTSTANAKARGKR